MRRHVRSFLFWVGEGRETAVSYKLTVNRCALHPNFWAVCLEDKNGGTRLTGSKCCGRWDALNQRTGKPDGKGPYVQWSMDERELRNIINACEAAITDLRSAPAEADAADA